MMIGLCSCNFKTTVGFGVINTGKQVYKVQFIQPASKVLLCQKFQGVFCSRKRHPKAKQRGYHLVTQAYSEEDQITYAREELDQLEQERDEATAVAEASAKRCKRLAEQIGRLNVTAMEEVKQGKEEQARKTLEEKCHLQKKYDRLQAKSETNYALAAKLEETIGKKQTELIAFMSKVGKLEYPSAAIKQEPKVTEYTEQYPARGENFQYSDSKPGFQSDTDLEQRFLELERQTLERMLSISQKDQNIFAGQKQEEKKEQVDEGFPEWWSAGNEQLSCGIFGVAQIDDRENQAELLLKQLVNSRVMGQDPDLPRTMVLVRLCSRELNIDETDGKGQYLQSLTEGTRNVVICSVEAARQIEETIRTSMFQNAVRQCMDCLANNEKMEGIEPKKAAPAVLMGLACVLGLDWKVASNLCAAQVCSWMGSKLLDIGADIRRSPTDVLLAGDNNSIVQLVRVLEAISPPLNSEHLKNVHEKVAGLLSYSELQAVSQMVAKITQQEKIRSVVRKSLGLY